MMVIRHSKKLFNKIFLLTLIIIALVLIIKEKNSSQTQIYILTSGIFIYLTWALVYHHFDKSLTFAVFIEYVLTAVLALILLLGVLF